MENFIKAIQRIIQGNFEGNISLFREGYGIYRLTSNDTSEAKDFHKNDLNDIKVVRWIDDYWIKVSLYLKKIDIESTYKVDGAGISKKDYLSKLGDTNLEIDKDYFETQISVSLFKGEYDSYRKCQLFRAEWDNYSIKQNVHPQPHWQFYQFDEYKQKLKAVSADDTFSVDEESGFEDYVETKFDFKKFHFAMNGNWINNETHVHSLNNQEKIGKWIDGLLKHLKGQIKYIS